MRLPWDSIFECEKDYAAARRLEFVLLPEEKDAHLGRMSGLQHIAVYGGQMDDERLAVLRRLRRLNSIDIFDRGQPVTTSNLAALAGVTPYVTRLRLLVPLPSPFQSPPVWRLQTLMICGIPNGDLSPLRSLVRLTMVLLGTRMPESAAFVEAMVSGSFPRLQELSLVAKQYATWARSPELATTAAFGEFVSRLTELESTIPPTLTHLSVVAFRSDPVLPARLPTSVRHFRLGGSKVVARWEHLGPAESALSAPLSPDAFLAQLISLLGASTLETAWIGVEWLPFGFGPRDRTQREAFVEALATSSLSEIRLVSSCRRWRTVEPEDGPFQPPHDREWKPTSRELRWIRESRSSTFRPDHVKVDHERSPYWAGTDFEDRRRSSD